MLFGLFIIFVLLVLALFIWLFVLIGEMRERERDLHRYGNTYHKKWADALSREDELLNKVNNLENELAASQNAYLTLGRYIFENKEKLNNEED